MVELIKLFGKEDNNPSDEKDFVRSYHYLMKAYESWIPIKEFQQLSPEIVRDLLELCKKDNEEMNKKVRRH